MADRLAFLLFSLELRLPEYGSYVREAINLIGDMPLKEQKEISNLVKSVLVTRGDYLSILHATEDLLAYTSEYNRMFSLLQPAVADSVHHCLAPLGSPLSDEEHFLCYGDISLSTAFSFACAGRKVDFVPTSSSYRHPAKFLSLIAQIHHPQGEIIVHDARDPDHEIKEAELDRYKGAFIYPNSDGRSFNLSPFTKNFKRGLVFLVPSTFLWTKTLENRKIRKDLIDGDNLKSIVLLPPNSVTDSSCIFALLVLNIPEDAKEVWFIDKSHQSIFSKRGQVLHDHLCLFDKNNKETAVRVDKAEIQKNEYIYDPQRYLGLQKTPLLTLPKDLCREIGEIADIIRAQEIKGVPENESVLQKKEFFPASINEIGLCTREGREVAIGKKEENRARRALIKEDDILLSIKSNCFRSGLWMWRSDEFFANAACVIIRIREEFKKSFPPFYVMRYLRSKEVKSYFDTVSTGSVAALLKMQDIKNLPVPIASDDFLEQEEKKWEQQLELFYEINQLREDMNNLSSENSFSSLLEKFGEGKE